MSHARWVPLLLVVALALTGCSGITVERLDDIPPELEGDTLGLTAVWSDDGESWLLVLSGSSTCPPELLDIRETGYRNFEITVGTPEAAEGHYCTLDAKPFIYRVPAPAPPGDPVTVNIVNGPNDPIGITL